MLSTGMKCLPKNILPSAKGNILHDCHAEVLAIRAFNRFLIDECAALVRSGPLTSSCVRRREVLECSQDYAQPFVLKEGVNIHMYCSEAPCGDASMELVMMMQEDSTPWEVSLASNMENGDLDSEGGLMGRGHFSKLGIVRRKPCKKLHHIVLSSH
jgi:tRNA-specific adenosine deaminase 1